jgi:MFS transporter, DHA1 family, multidrug resistance protein
VAVAANTEQASTASRSWQRNLYALTFASLLMFTAFGFVFPFLPLFIAQLGVGDLHHVEIWAGVTSFSQAIVLALFAPIWGAIADRHGRRLMVLRVAFAGAVIIGLMGLSQNIWQFLGLRIIQGTLTGVVAAATALATTFVPRERVGYALGFVQMSLFAGNAIGPLIGGFAADRVGYRWSFAVSAVLFLAAAVVVLVFVREDFVPPPPGEGSNGLAGLLADIRSRGRDRQLVIMMIVLFSVQYGVNVVLPILPLFVESLDIADSPATLTGLIYTVAGLVAAVSSIVMGRIGDRVGYRRMMVVMAVGAALCYIPQAFVQSAAQLIVLRGVLGIFDGGLLPSANAVIAANTEAQGQRSAHATTYGLAYLANGFGFALGPLSGGFISATLGLRSVFLLTAGILLAVGLYLPFGTKGLRRPALATIPAPPVS